MSFLRLLDVDDGPGFIMDFGFYLQSSGCEPKAKMKTRLKNALRKGGSFATADTDDADVNGGRKKRWLAEIMPKRLLGPTVEDGLGRYRRDGKGRDWSIVGWRLSGYEEVAPCTCTQAAYCTFPPTFQWQWKGGRSLRQQGSREWAKQN